MGAGLPTSIDNYAGMINWDNHRVMATGTNVKTYDARITSADLRAMHICASYAKWGERERSLSPEDVAWAKEQRGLSPWAGGWVYIVWVVRDLARRDDKYGEGLYEVFCDFIKESFCYVPTYVPAPLFGELGIFVKEAWYVSRIRPTKQSEVQDYAVIQFLGVKHPNDKMKRKARFRYLQQDKADGQLRLSEVGEHKLTQFYNTSRDWNWGARPCPLCGSYWPHEQVWVAILPNRGMRFCAHQRVEPKMAYEAAA